MNPLLVVGIGVLGGLGAVLRFAIDGAVARRLTTSLPAGTLAVNLIGAFCLGLLAGLGGGHDLQLLLATGLLGALTTFSTWALESERLGEEGLLGFAVANFALSIALGVALVWLGTELGGRL